MNGRYVLDDDADVQAETDAAYDRWAPIYDVLFELPFRAGRIAAARAADSATPERGDLIVVGVGTGLELTRLTTRARVVGIDLSEPMLEAARRRVARKGIAQVRALIRMDARAMSFEAESFDAALAPYVLSVVPEPQRMLDEIWRVLRPGGEMVFVNHFSAQRGLRAWGERQLERTAGWLGWHPEFPFRVVEDWLADHADAELRERRAVGWFYLFTLVRIGKRA